ncbi:MAG: hypothetical protein SWY16_10470 [Cyanobacteriota bacterium]|nr:hypothetical protein [Cyanobacteriota bacterium]
MPLLLKMLPTQVIGRGNGVGERIELERERARTRARSEFADRSSCDGELRLRSIRANPER